MLTLSKQSDYALIIVSQLRDRNEFVPLSELVGNTKLPQRFLARIAARLVAEKILLSREGRVGGYKLSPKIGEVNTYDFFSIFEKQLGFLDCMKKPPVKCKFDKVCKHRHGVYTKLNEVVVAQMKRTRLMDLF